MAQQQNSYSRFVTLTFNTVIASKKLRTLIVTCEATLDPEAYRVIVYCYNFGLIDLIPILGLKEKPYFVKKKKKKKNTAYKGKNI